MIVLAMIVAGGLGAVLRFLVEDACRRRWPTAISPIFGINVTGSLVVGLVVGAVVSHGASADWQLVVGTGLCGGYTTFSTSIYEAVRLGTKRGTLYAALTLVSSVAACALGWVIATV